MFDITKTQMESKNIFQLLFSPFSISFKAKENGYYDTKLNFYIYEATKTIETEIVRLKQNREQKGRGE